MRTDPNPPAPVILTDRARVLVIVAGLLLTAFLAHVWGMTS